jgi:acetyl-CoA acetyltransferase
MAMRKVAVVGAGMTKFMRRAQETGRELAFQASRMARFLRDDPR